MKYFAYWQAKYEDMEKAIENNEKFKKAREKNPEKYAKTVHGPFSLNRDPHSGDARGLTIIEADNTDQLNEFAFMVPEIKIKFEPIFENAGEIYLRSRKSK